MADHHEILTVKELCDLLRVHPATVYKMARKGKIPGFRVGTEWRFRKDAILRWMAEKSMQSRQVRKVIETGVSFRSAQKRVFRKEGLVARPMIVPIADSTLIASRVLCDLAMRLCIFGLQRTGAENPPPGLTIE